MSAEHLIIIDLDYVIWMFREPNPTRVLSRAKMQVSRAVQLFDDRPIMRRCQNSVCRKLATRCSVYRPLTQPMWWCDNCNPHMAGASLGKLQIIKSYWDAVGYAGLYCDRRELTMNSLIQELAYAKRLPVRATEEQDVANFL